MIETSIKCHGFTTSEAKYQLRQAISVTILTSIFFCCFSNTGLQQFIISNDRLNQKYLVTHGKKQQAHARVTVSISSGLNQSKDSFMCISSSNKPDGCITVCVCVLKGRVEEALHKSLITLRVGSGHQSGQKRCEKSR